MLSVSGIQNINDRMINEYEAVCGIKTGRRK
jgi:hypothetical protein